MSKANTSLIWALTFLTSVVIGGIVLLAIFGPKENTVIASTLQAIVTIITLIAGILITLKVTSESKAVSEDTNTKMTTVVADVNKIHTAVNSAKDALEAQVAELVAKVLEKDKVIAAGDTTLAVERSERAADKIAQQVKSDTASAIDTAIAATQSTKPDEPI